MINVEKQKCIVELGNTKINCVIAEPDKDYRIKILARSSALSTGIHNGVIINPSKTIKEIKDCISDIESKINITIKKINLVFESPEFTCTRLSKYVKIDGAKIQKEDIVFLLKEAKKEVIFNDKNKTIIHIFNHNYIVDEKEFIKEPIDVYADYLSHEMTFITLPKNIIKNFNEVLFECDLEIERLISSTFALAVNYFNDTEFELGSTIIDIGYEKTSVGVFKDFALIHSRTFPIGIHHVSKDISRGCSLTLKEAKTIRDQIGCNFWKKNINLETETSLPKNIFFESSYRKITKSLVSEIIIARIEEILELVKKEINLARLNLISGQSIFIVGGGSYLPNLKKFCETFFSANVKILEHLNNNSKSVVEKQEDFASCNGALKIIFYGWETEALPAIVDKNQKKRGFFSKILGYGT